MSATRAVADDSRLTSLDAYRGFVMLAMASGGLAIPKVARAFPDSPFWQSLAYQLEHVEWRGCSAWDLIQPSFMFMVGVALPFSIAKRRAHGGRFGTMLRHAVVRSLILILLAVFLSSNSSPVTNYTFVNVLAQIGLGYTFVFLLVGRGLLAQAVACGAILFGYWLAFALYPVRPPAPLAGITGGAEFSGFFAHWNKHTNLAAAFDSWFLNLFPPHRYLFNEGGYQTLNFVPSMATMLFGVMAGELLRGPKSLRKKCGILVVAGTAALGIGLALDNSVCPVVKRIWTPSWAIFSTAWCLWLLAAFVWVIEVQRRRGWAFPLAVVGMNSIAMYVMAQLLPSWIKKTLKTHLPEAFFSGTYGPIAEQAGMLFVLWLACYWLYRRKVFLRI